MLHFEWDREKELINIQKHKIDFNTAILAFEDPDRIILFDEQHSSQEFRFFCFSKVRGKIVTVRFVYQGETIRIFGAGYWRKGRKFCEEQKAKKNRL